MRELPPRLPPRSEPTLSRGRDPRLHCTPGLDPPGHLRGPRGQRQPALDQMLLDAKTGKVDILLVWRSDRLFRSLMSARSSMSSSFSATPLIPSGAFPAAAWCWPPIHLARSGRSTPMPWGCSASHRATAPRASYAFSGPRTPARADSAGACLSPGLAPRCSRTSDARALSLLRVSAKEEGRETGALRESANTCPPSTPP
jgi:hypothetical protein